MPGFLTLLSWDLAVKARSIAKRRTPMREKSTRYAWMNGEFIPWQDATIHVSTSCVTLGSRVFEGIRAYWNERQQQLYIFKVGPHLTRLYQSAKIMRMSPAYGPSQLQTVLLELLTRNQYKEDVHMVPAIYFGSGRGFMSYKPEDIDTGMYVTAVPRRSQLRSGSGIHVCVSSWIRISDRDMPPRVKVSANYQNGRLAAVQAAEDGYDDAILLNQQGNVAEAPGACIFLVRDGTAVTPTVTSGILESITRATVIELFENGLSIPVIERDVDRTELYVADEVFICGSALEITPVLSVDRYVVGDGQIGRLTAQMQHAYEEIVRGENSRYEEWLLPVYGP
jgi:branched-chain amino acid aminotransferase